MEKHDKINATRKALNSLRNHRIVIAILLVYITLSHTNIFSRELESTEDSVSYFDPISMNTASNMPHNQQPASSSSTSTSSTSSTSNSLNKDLFEGVRRTWEHYGAKRPMFGVLTNDAYKDESNMTEEAVREFWATGQRNIENIVQGALPEHNISIAYESALDFGSGVGRLTIPLASYFQRVYAVDISQHYLDVLMSNAKVFGADSRVVPTLNEGDIAAAVYASNDGQPVQVDFILSLIAIQHNPPLVQRLIMKQLLSLLRPGGVAYLHVPYALGPGMKDSTKLMMERSKTEQGVDKMQMHYTPEVLIKYIAEEESGCTLLAVLDRKVAEGRLSSGRFLIQKNLL